MLGEDGMTEKRFYVAESNLIEGYCVFDREKKYAFHPRPRKADCLNDAHTLNELHEENHKIKSILLKKVEELNEAYNKSAKAGMPTGGIIGELDSFEEICKIMEWIE